MSSITQTTQDWDVGFVPKTVTAVEKETSLVGRSCPTATSTKTSITFGEITLSKPGDSCSYEFTIENNVTIDADLDSILFSDSLEETYLLNNDNLRRTGEYYWLSSPVRFNGIGASERVVNTSGNYSNGIVHSTDGGRPAVSLTPGTEYTSGTGSKSDPNIVQ